MQFFKKNICKAVVFIVLGYGSSLFAFIVYIDPGHGGGDSGAVLGSMKESHIVLRVGIELADLINSTRSFKAILSRREDLTLKLDERIKGANDSKADLFVSLHVNSSIDPKSRGIEFYFENHLPPDEETLYLASIENESQNHWKDNLDLQSVPPGKKTDLSGILQDLNRHHRMRESFRWSQELVHFFQIQKYPSKILQAPFRVVTKVHMPAVLVELGYLTHPKEGESLNQTEVQKQIAWKLFEGIKNYKESKESIDKTSKSILN